MQAKIWWPIVAVAFFAPACDSGESDDTEFEEEWLAEPGIETCELAVETCLRFCDPLPIESGGGVACTVNTRWPECVDTVIEHQEVVERFPGLISKAASVSAHGVMYCFEMLDNVEAFRYEPRF